MLGALLDGIELAKDKRYNKHQPPVK